jgi:Protein of unknown function (DUF4245)
MSAAKAPRIVAELGRPETPQETAVRLAENSRNYRARKTVNNLVLSLLATLAAVFVLILIVPRSDTPLERTVDYHEVARQAQNGIAEPLVDPALPTSWHANVAEWRTGASDKVPSWYIGLVTPHDQFIGLTQAINANASWVADALQRQAASATVTIDGVTWDVYRNTVKPGDRGNFDYALVTTAGHSTYLLVGTATETEFAELAGTLAAQIAANGAGS